MKLPFKLLLELKGSHLAAIVILKFTVRNVDAAGKLIVACLKASFCGKLQWSFLSPVSSGQSAQQGLAPLLFFLAAMPGPRSEDDCAQPGSGSCCCGIMTCVLLVLFEP